MKKRSCILGVAALVILFMNACSEKHGPKGGGESAIPDSDLLSYKTAKRYVQNYAPHAGIVKNLTSDTLPDTRCIWFSAQRLRALADQVEKEHGDGVRFYLSTYDKQYIDSKQPNQPARDYWGYNTLVMVSTQDINGNHVDYYTDTINADAAKRHGFIVLALPENRGELCPPPSKCRDIGATLLDN